MVNIFFLSECPVQSAQYACDKHVVKMPIETAQILSTTFRLLTEDSETADRLGLYKLSHVKHPMAIWTRQSLANFQWALDHGLALCDEYYARYGKAKNKHHASRAVLLTLKEHQAKIPFPRREFTVPPTTIPDEYKLIGDYAFADVVRVYRQVYLHVKSRFAVWKHSGAPDWWPAPAPEISLK